MSCGQDRAIAADAALLQRAAAGDSGAFADLFERYQQVVYRFARAMTGSADAADDITQEVFVVLMRDLARYAPERAALSTYLYGIARNVSRDRLRRERRLLSWLVDLTRRRPVPPADPFDTLAATEAREAVRRGLASLPVRYREVVILCDLHELSYGEIAGVLHLSTSAVRSRLHRGRALLRQRVSGRFPASAEAVRSSLRCSV
jgi:RNA polymerase sigma-70 factor (ECF subfamily)